jgi:hypothetical protein
MHRARDARGNGFHPTRERLLARCFDHQMNVVALDREVRDAEFAALARRSEAAAEFIHETSSSQRRQTLANPQRHVRRTLARDRLAADVMDDRAPTSRSARARARTASPGAASMVIEGELHPMHRWF